MDWHHSYIELGNPFVTCPKCAEIVKLRHVNEWQAMSKYKKFGYYFSVYFYSIWFTLGCLLILILIIEELFNLDLITMETTSGLLTIIFSVTIIAIVLVFEHKKFQKLIKESKERTKNIEYKKLLGISSSELLK
jgi:hypothetical protein